jgi:cyclic pyranopterin monophosphate synthase
MENDKFSHIDAEGNPSMVDVSGKATTVRMAVAEGVVRPGPEIMGRLRQEEIITKKGPVFQTAILAALMGAKRTSDLIPLCHPLAIEDCKVEIKAEKDTIVIRSRVKTTGRTGVEMEALTAVSIAALTIYDMCKALSHDIQIENIRLIEKTGGKNDFKSTPQ